MSAFPETASALLDRVGPLYGLNGELHAALAGVPLVLVETSAALGATSELRATLGVHSRSALVLALSRLGAGRVAGSVDVALAGLGSEVVRGLAIRAGGGAIAAGSRAGAASERALVRCRAGAAVAGATGRERAARIAEAMRAVGLDRAAAVHERLAAELAANPFNAVSPYGVGFDLGPARALGAKTYFACEWPDVTLATLGGPLAAELGIQGAEAFELLAASARANWRRARWLIDVSFALPADPSDGVRAKVYVPARRLAVNEAQAHSTVLWLASRLGLDPRGFERLAAAVRPDGLSRERPCSLTLGVSASRAGPSLEVYLFDPARFTPAQ